MKTKTKTWVRALLVCMIMSLFCVNVHSNPQTDAERLKFDSIEKAAFIKSNNIK